MKWRLTFGDPRIQKRGTLASQIIEIPAGNLAEEGWVHPSLMKLDTAVAIAEKDPSVHYHVARSIVEAVLVRDEDHVVKWEIPYPIARLTFDPTKTKKPGLRRVWADPLARTIWIVVKATHLTDQYFEKRCLVAAKEIRRARPTTVEELQKAMRVNMWGNMLTSRESFWEQFLPCILGTRQIGYEVISSPTAQ